MKQLLRKALEDPVDLDSSSDEGGVGPGTYQKPSDFNVEKVPERLQFFGS